LVDQKEPSELHLAKNAEEFAQLFGALESQKKKKEALATRNVDG